MKNYKSEPSKKTPLIEGDIEQGTILVKGKSLPEDTGEFFVPFMKWLQEFVDETPNGISVTLDIDYMNTSSALYIMLMLQKFKPLSGARKVNVKWLYEEDDYEMQMVGEEYQAILGDIVEIIEKKL